MQMGNLRLDSKTAAFKGGISGQIIHTGDSAKSTLYQRVAGIGEQARMPMGAKPLDAASIAILKAWIDQGANWPDGVGAASAEIKKHWAFVAPVKTKLPEVKNKSWVRNPIDTYVLARLEKEGLQPSAEADEHAAAAAEPRSHRPASFATGSGCFSQRHVGQGI